MLTIFLALFLLGTATARAADSFLLDAIKNQPVIEGCTCEFHQPNAEVKGVTDLVFVSAVDWEQATVNADGNVALTKVSAVPSDLPAAKGMKTKIRFAGPEGLQVDLDLTVNDVCPPSRPCDTTGLEGTMSAVRGGRQGSTVIIGSCGC